MFKSIYTPFASRIAVRNYAGRAPPGIRNPNDVQLSKRRVMRKIRVGKARPAIFYQFDTLVELSDGSVIKRRSQAPKDEIRLIADQRNAPLWNPTRSDLVVDQSNTGKVSKFRSKYGNYDQGVGGEAKKFSSEELLNQSEEEREQARQEAAERERQFLEFMGQDAEIITGGKLFDKKAQRKK